MDTKPRPTVVWFHFQECTCSSESFIRSSHPIVSDIILDKISLDYTETLQAAAGKQAEEALQSAMTKHKGEYPLLNTLPRMYLVTVSIAEMQPMRMELSGEVRASLAAVERTVHALLNDIC